MNYHGGHGHGYDNLPQIRDFKNPAWDPSWTWVQEYKKKSDGRAAWKALIAY
jgi:hypothetical protein